MGILHGYFESVGGADSSGAGQFAIEDTDVEERRLPLPSLRDSANHSEDDRTQSPTVALHNPNSSIVAKWLKPPARFRLTRAQRKTVRACNPKGSQGKVRSGSAPADRVSAQQRHATRRDFGAGGPAEDRAVYWTTQHPLSPKCICRRGAFADGARPLRSTHIQTSFTEGDVGACSRAKHWP